LGLLSYLSHDNRLRFTKYFSLFIGPIMIGLGKIIKIVNNIRQSLVNPLLGLVHNLFNLIDGIRSSLT
jgi:hypothetical protein